MQDELQIPSKTCEVVLPDRTTVTIREQNGYDDEVISLMANNKDNTALSKFLLGIIKSDNPATGKPYTLEDIQDWRVNNHGYLILMSRIFSLGEDLDVQFTCPHCGKEHKDFEEKLQQFCPDQGDTPKKLGDEGYFKYACTPYHNADKQRELPLSSGRTVVYDYMTSKDETKLLDLPEDNISVTTALRLRNLSIKNTEGKLIKLERYDVFTAREMAEIRKDITLMDPRFNAISSFKCQNPSCKITSDINLLTQANFFFPGATP